MIIQLCYKGSTPHPSTLPARWLWGGWRCLWRRPGSHLIKQHLGQIRLTVLQLIQLLNQSVTVTIRDQHWDLAFFGHVRNFFPEWAPKPKWDRKCSTKRTKQLHLPCSCSRGFSLLSHPDPVTLTVLEGWIQWGWVPHIHHAIQPRRLRSCTTLHLMERVLLSGGFTLSSSLPPAQQEGSA